MGFYPDLEGKVVVVTGASGDIGAAICRKYLDLGSRVYAIYRSDEAGLLKLAAGHGNGALLNIAKCDVVDRDDIDRLVQKIDSEAGRVDVLVNNAGANKDSLFAAMSYEDFDAVVKVNLYGTFNVSRAMLRLLRVSRGTSVVNVSSVAGLMSNFGQANYSAAKAGIIGLTRTMARELADKGVRVNAVAPGLIDSRMVSKVPRQMARLILDAVPMKRLGRVEEVADAVAFLSSESSSYIVGQVLIVDGGLVMR